LRKESQRLSSRRDAEKGFAENAGRAEFFQQVSSGWWEFFGGLFLFLCKEL
jgi:hypothetical protein